MNWFTSDLHYNHARIIGYCNRPFKDVVEMNEVLVKNWNSKIQPTDTVYFLGDLGFFNSPAQVDTLMKMLNGTKFLIYGNHDKTNVIKSTGFQWQGFYKEVYINNQMIVLMHYALRVWNKSHHGSWHLYGHSHGTLPDNPNSLSLDVGVDTNNYYPFSFYEIKDKMVQKNFIPVDHHGK